MTVQHKIGTSDTSKPTNKPAKGVLALVKLPNKNKKVWLLITDKRSSTFGGSEYTGARIGFNAGDSFSFKENQIVRCGRPGEVFTITHK